MLGHGGAFVLRGRIVRDDGSHAHRNLVVKSGRVVSITRHRPAVPPRTVEVQLGPEDWIFPGFIDLHSHTAYNALPLWAAPNAPYDNRFEWRASEAYARDVSGLHAHVLASFPRRDPHRRVLLALFAELQALAGGTTTLQESQALEEEPCGQAPVLLRSTASSRDLGLPTDRTVLSVIDFFAPDAAGQPVEKARWSRGDGRGDTWIEHYASLLRSDELAGCLVHLAEGRSGVGTAGVDLYTRAEFEAFMSHEAFRDADRVRQSRLVLIHGCGIDTENPKHIAFLQEREIAVVWSPVSNLILYQDTLDVERLIEAGVRVVLGSDWSPSGSKHVWDEARFARFLIDAAGFSVSDAQLLQMITTGPAHCLGQPQLGCLGSGSEADFFILRSPVESDSALEALFRSTDRHVRAVVVGGRAIYGEQRLLEEFDVETQPLPQREGTSVVNKGVHIPVEIRPGHPFDLAREVDELEDFLKEVDPPLGPVLRSNLLVDSDRPYRERIVELKARALRWADVVRERRRPRSHRPEGVVQ